MELLFLVLSTSFAVVNGHRHNLFESTTERLVKEQIRDIAKGFPDVLSFSIHPPAHNYRSQWPYNKNHNFPLPLQSPVNIRFTDVKPIHLTPLRAHVFRDLPREAVRVENTGYYLEVRLNQRNGPAPYITGGPLMEDRYNFEQMHFHWGETNDCGSENRIDGFCYSTEVHIVHYNQKYGSYNASIRHKDGVAVVSLFGEVTRRDNPDFDDLVRLIPRIVVAHSETRGTFREEFKFVHKSLEQNSKYYAMPGSLTTAPYSECVTWIMYSEPFYLSSRQLNAFRQLENTNGTSLICQNDRPLQDFNGRPVVTPYFKEQAEIVSSRSG